MAGLSEDSTDIFLSQISMLTDWDVMLLQECFRKQDGVNVAAHELFTPSELVRGLQCPAVTIHQRWRGQSKAVGGASRWTAVELDGQMTIISAHVLHKERHWGFRVGSDVNPRFHEREIGTPLDPGWRLQCEFVRIDRQSSRGRVDSKTENVDCTRFTHCRDRNGLDGDEHLDGRRHRVGIVHTVQLDGLWRRVDTHGFYHDTRVRERE